MLKAANAAAVDAVAVVAAAKMEADARRAANAAAKKYVDTKRVADTERAAADAAAAAKKDLVNAFMEEGGMPRAEMRRAWTAGQATSINEVYSISV